MDILKLPECKCKSILTEAKSENIYVYAYAI